MPVHDDRTLFEYLILEGAQAGLSWETILKRRDGYRQAFDNFDVKKIARYDDAKIEQLMQDTGIIRNRLKIKSAIGNAQACLRIQQEHGSLNQFIWSFINHRPIQNNWQDFSQVPVTTDIAKNCSKALQGYGMKFVGATIIYAYMQVVGMVNDHEVGCYRHIELA